MKSLKMVNVAAMAVLRGSALALMLLGTAGTALAQAFPHSLVASPDIYKVIAEDLQYRVIEVNWQPGQRDVMHSHPARAIYHPMDCRLRLHFPNGVTLDYVPIHGTASVHMPEDAHMKENIGTKACKLIYFEPK